MTTKSPYIASLKTTRADALHRLSIALNERLAQAEVEAQVPIVFHLFEDPKEFLPVDDVFAGRQMPGIDRPVDRKPCSNIRPNEKDQIM
jgi:hypothetical protein